MARLTLCADDFGLGPEIDEAILSLIEQGRLNAVSCMPTGPTFGANIASLLDAAHHAPIPVQIGLHLTFTEYSPAGEMPELAPDGVLPEIGTLIRKAYTGQLHRPEISAPADAGW